MSAIVDRTTLLIAALAAGLFYFAYHKSGQVPWGSLDRAGRLFVGIVPKMAFGLLLGTLLVELLPAAFVEGWLSDRSGFRGIAVGWVAGSLMPMGAPFVLFPMAAGMMKGGAGMGPVVAMLTASALFGPMRILVYEIPIMGTAFFAARFLAVFWMPPVAGALAQAAARLIRGG